MLSSAPPIMLHRTRPRGVGPLAGLPVRRSQPGGRCQGAHCGSGELRWLRCWSGDLPGWPYEGGVELHVVRSAPGWRQRSMHVKRQQASNPPCYPRACPQTTQDLYVSPVALVGCGMGAATALLLAQQNQFLAGAVLAAEFSLPVAALREGKSEASANGSSGSDGRDSAPVVHAPSGPSQASVPAVVPAQQAAQPPLSSKQLLPWWGFRPGQASVFSSLEQCAACLAHPLANLSPGVVAPLAHAAAAAALATTDTGDGVEQAAAEAAAPVRQLLAQLQRPLRGTVASACSLLRLPARVAGGGGWGIPFPEDEDTELQPRTDPSMLFHFEPAALLAGLPALRCHLLLLHGGRGSWVEPADAAAMAQIAAQGTAASAAVAELPNGGHYLAADQPDVLLQQIVKFLEGPAIRCFSRAALMGTTNGAAAGGASNDADVRRPEVLDLKPLPQYASLEEAQKVRVGLHEERNTRLVARISGAPASSPPMGQRSSLPAAIKGACMPRSAIPPHSCTGSGPPLHPHRCRHRI